MNRYQRHLYDSIQAHLREAAYHRYCLDVQTMLNGPACLIDVHRRQLDKLRGKVGGLLLDLMNSGLSHRKVLTIIRRLEGGK